MFDFELIEDTSKSLEASANPNYMKKKVEKIYERLNVLSTKCQTNSEQAVNMMDKPLYNNHVIIQPGILNELFNKCLSIPFF